MRDLNELRRLAEAAYRNPYGYGDQALADLRANVAPIDILCLLARMEQAEKRADWLVRENRRVCARTDAWVHLAGEMLSAVPLRHTLKAGETASDFVAYIKGCVAENDRFRGLLAEAGKALEPFAAQAVYYDPDEGDGELPVWDFEPKTRELRTARTVADKIEEALK